MESKQTRTGQTGKPRGRPALESGVETVPVTIRMTSPQKDKLARLGGPQWVRAKIDKAPEPKE
jgi:hypothetical protein